MRLVNVVVGIPVMILGAGSLWLGLNIAFDRSRDSDPGTLYAIGGLFAIIGVILLCAAVAVMVQALDYVLPRWLAVAVGVLGLLPFPVLMGAFHCFQPAPARRGAHALAGARSRPAGQAP